MDRRSFIAAGTTTAVIASLRPTVALAQAAASGSDARLNALFERIFNDRIDNSPEAATSLGLDKGPRAALKSQLSPVTEAEAQKDLARTKRWLGELEAFPVAGLSRPAMLNREIVLYSLRNGWWRATSSASIR